MKEKILKVLPITIKIINAGIILLGIYMVLDGIDVMIGTSGVVRGSEFGMMITLASQISQIVLMVGLFSLRKLALEYMHD